jgi:hypothetical protein
MKEKENETSIKRSGVKLNTVIKKEVIQFENVVTQLKIFVKCGLAVKLHCGVLHIPKFHTSDIFLSVSEWESKRKEAVKRKYRKMLKKDESTSTVQATYQLYNAEEGNVNGYSEPPRQR